MLKIYDIKEKKKGKVEMESLATAVEVLIKEGFAHTDAEFVQFLQKEGERIEDSMPAALGAFMAEVTHALNYSPMEVMGCYAITVEQIVREEVANRREKEK